MRRRELLRRCIFGAGSVLTAPMLNLGRCRLYAGSDEQYSVRTIDLVGRSLVIDMLGLLTTDWRRLRGWHKQPLSFGSEDLALLRASGITVFHPAVDLNVVDAHSPTDKWLRAWNGFVAGHADQLVRISGCEDLRGAKSQGKIGILLGMQNSEHFRTVGDVRTFYELGQRVSQLTYNGTNRIGHGCVERKDDGLTDFGGAVVGAMNECGMAIDVSHAGDRTTLETFEASRVPVLITHANCRALNPHPRCKPDHVIKAMARGGGVIGITSIRAFVRGGTATVEDTLDHFDHVVRLAGVEHVGIGSDTDLRGQGRPGLDVPGLDHPLRVFELVEGLIKRRYSDSGIEAILGGNFQRALTAVFCKDETPALSATG